jgi:hypothetical protein
MPSLLEIAVAFFEMSDSPFGFEQFSQNRRSSFQVATLSSAVVFIGCHKTQPFLCLKK